MNGFSVLGESITYVNEAGAIIMDATRIMVSTVSRFFSGFGRDTFSVVISLSLGGVRCHRYRAIAPTPKINTSMDRRMGTSCKPHGVKFSPRPMIGTIARERAKLSAIRSIVSITVFIFLSGKRAKLSRYPGMNNKKGKPRMIRMVPSIFNKIKGNRIMLHSRQRRTSARGLFNTIFMFHQRFM